MTQVEALKLALSKEVNSIELYRKLANQYPAIKELLDSLVIEEEKHKALIEKKIAEVTRY